MKKIKEIRSKLLGKDVLSTNQMSKIKGGKADDEIRRPRPGGGITTHSGTIPNSNI